LSDVASFRSFTASVHGATVLFEWGGAPQWPASATAEADLSSSTSLEHL
jgi:hypothetical protein